MGGGTVKKQVQEINVKTVNLTTKDRRWDRSKGKKNIDTILSVGDIGSVEVTCLPMLKTF